MLLGWDIIGQKNVTLQIIFKFFDWAIILIKDGSYVDSQSSEDMAIQKGTPTQVA